MGASRGHGLGLEYHQTLFPRDRKSQRQGQGALGISITHRETEINRAFIDAGTQLGIPEVPDLNHDEQLGVGYISATLLNGKRSSTASAFLYPVMKRRICTSKRMS